MKLYGRLENHKLIIENQIEAKEKGLPLVEIEVAYDGSLWEAGYAPEKPTPTHDEVSKMREEYRKEHIDSKTAERTRKTANQTWTADDERAYLDLDAEVTAYIEENFPYNSEA